MKVDVCIEKYEIWEDYNNRIHSESLKAKLKDVENYCNTWGLKINVAKTKAMVFENGRSTHIDLYIYNTPVEIVQSFKYLGFHFFKNGIFLKSQKIIAQHAYSFSLYRLF